MDPKDKPDLDPLAKLHDQWASFSPSMMDPTPYTFTSFASQQPAYYAPTTLPAGLVNPPHPADLTTPSMALNMLTPLGIPPSAVTDPTMPHSAMEMGGYHPAFASHHHQPPNLDAFGNPHSFAPPSSFLRREPTMAALSQPMEEAAFGNLAIRSPSMGVIPSRLTENLNDFEDESETYQESFRFNVALRAATAMIKDNDDIPVTYLNKGQAYTINVQDIDPMASGAQPIKYRTCIRVSFDEEGQRSRPAACWMLWKEGRGSNEAHQREGRLLAVEHVDPNQGGAGDRQSRVQLEKAHFDGFSVIWSPNMTTGTPETNISVRFNFLSTDFSHSKGVKGIPVRLCAKTEVLMTNTPEPSPSNTQEVCYCKVKLFRDHGAERKLSNDVAHVKKMVEKVRQQIAQAELGSTNIDKRKRSCSVVNTKGGPKSMKGKNKRPWTMSGNDSKSSIEEDLQLKMANLDSMFTSPQPISLLNLRGDEQDDPDLFPVALDPTNDEDCPGRVNFDSTHSNDGESTSNAFSPFTNNHSPSSSHRSFDIKRQSVPNDSRYSRRGSLDWSNTSQRGGDSIRHGQFINHPVKVQLPNGVGGESDWIEAMGVDHTYKPPNEPLLKPKCCFYVRPRQNMSPQAEDYYHAVYLAERTGTALVQAVVKKCRFDSARVVRAFVVQNNNGMNVMLDDDVVRELPEGKTMTVEFAEMGDPNIKIEEKSSETVTDVEMRFFL
ncbi:hypothetical protein LOZ53_000733 [Ophidiomyces ophidiicola]|nr:hypothetical protein LOZ64_004777 [Ophidiomyces ophidiicola]KAI1979379.1 hypothetical protein LOZ55_001961 [Ophidiomyces ophidiicola]KAI1992840.1 hypothetical protein LOZ51_004153 [Ophidiomyces ophidiicola]KAI1997372.1 hypothetical protein LOZ53_000733 [Ophidiomyces ophidiicola]KAI2005754.1 hypothetical protein LOZ50_003540 [Ophidiomyces ophidiicola]